MEVPMKNLLVVFSVIALVAACTKKQTVKEEAYPGETVFEEISPNEFDTSSIVFEESMDTIPAKSFFEEPTEEKPTVISAPATRGGYRVQIGAYRTEREANAMAARARSQLTRSVYVQYIAPFYKVRVGDFLNKYEATQYREQVRMSGFRDAFVAESEIVVK
jgi:cell division septation protein DedD